MHRGESIIDIYHDQISSLKRLRTDAYRVNNNSPSPFHPRDFWSAFISPGVVDTGDINEKCGQA